MKFIRSLGLMSGTSMDGLDCGLFDISLTSDYQLDWKLIDFKTIPYSKKMRNLSRFCRVFSRRTVWFGKTGFG